MPIRKPVTLKDISKATGVDVSAVSRVLNNSRSGSRVSEATRKLILDTAKTMRYQPNALARGLERHQSGMFGVVLGATTEVILHPYTGTFLQGIVDGAAEANYQPILFTTSWDEAEENVGSFCDRRADGLIVISPPEDSTVIARVQDYGVPVIGFDVWPDRYGCRYVGLDEAESFRVAVRHLLEQGHRRIAYVSAEVGTYYSQYRQVIAEKVFQELQVPEPLVHILPTSLPIPAQSELVRAYLDSQPRPTAIIAFNDHVALSLMEAAEGLGIAIPDQLSIIGFDDTPAAAVSHPPLTTIYQPIRDMGCAAVRLLLKLISAEDDETVEGSILFQTRFVVRSSTGPAQTS